MIVAEYLKQLAALVRVVEHDTALSEFNAAVDQLCNENARLLDDLLETKRECWRKDRMIQIVLKQSKK
jgi:hypothetical protein